MAEETGAAKAEKSEPTTYHRDRLLAEADAFFGVPTHVVAAALSMGRAANKVHFTRDEADKLVKAALDHEVEVDYNQPDEEA